MARHKFDGTWTHFKISDSFPPTIRKAGDFVLDIPNASTGNLASGKVEGKPVTGKATGDTLPDARLDLSREEPGNIRTYEGHLIGEFKENGKVFLVILGRYKDTPVVAKKPKASKKLKKLADSGQDEGTWVIVK